MGSILGVTKDVDMNFTRKFGRSRMQVMVLDSNLIPKYVDVVIGDFLYELQFRVEDKVDENVPQPIVMDTDDQDEDEEQKKNGAEEPVDQDGTPCTANNSYGKNNGGSTSSPGARRHGMQRAGFFCAGRATGARAGIPCPVVYLNIPGF